MENPDLEITKVLIARYSPANKCFAEEGELLLLKPKGKVKIERGKYTTPFFFTGMRTGKKSKYGWVKNIAPVSLKEFAQQNNTTIEAAQNQTLLFKAISNYDEETPLAVSYKQKSFDSEEGVLDVHKVIFHIG